MEKHSLPFTRSCFSFARKLARIGGTSPSTPFLGGFSPANTPLTKQTANKKIKTKCKLKINIK